MSKMFGFSTVSSSWVIIFSCCIGFNKLEAVSECLTATEVMPLLFDALWICFPLFFENNLYYSLALVGSGIFFVSGK